MTDSDMSAEQVEKMIPCLDDWCVGNPWQCACKENLMKALTAAEQRGYERGLDAIKLSIENHLRLGEEVHSEQFRHACGLSNTKDEHG